MNTNPYCRLRVAFGGMKKGHIFRPTGVYRDQLIRGGFVEVIKPEDVAPALSVAAKPEVELPRSSRMLARKKAAH